MTDFKLNEQLLLMVCEAKFSKTWKKTQEHNVFYDVIQGIELKGKELKLKCLISACKRNLLRNILGALHAAKNNMNPEKQQQVKVAKYFFSAFFPCFLFNVPDLK